MCVCVCVCKHRQTGALATLTVTDHIVFRAVSMEQGTEIQLSCLQYPNMKNGGFEIVGQIGFRTGVGIRKKKRYSCLWDIGYETQTHRSSAGNGLSAGNISFSQNDTPTDAAIFVPGSLQSGPERLCIGKRSPDRVSSLVVLLSII